MSTLAKLQERFQTAVLAENPVPGLFAAEVPLLEGGFGVYLRAYRARLTAALRDNFPVLQRALGDDAFDALANAYIDENPSHFRSIRWFGDSLAEFLAAAPERLPHPALVDLARMDWATRTAFDAADAALLSFGELAALPPEDWPQRRFKPVPSLQLLDLAWGVEPTWKALNADAAAVSVEPLPVQHVLLIWRPELDCCWRSADTCEAAILRALTRGASFADCCTLIAETGDAQAARTAAGFLQRWIAEGLLAGD
ncbi:MAG: putative DNA-binding domain-containing protein [Candidatus Accumulibacter sp.]|uniref:DNA-binding domain-containing protein n=1 Tax=Candidatus Accumulibacter affinis TaxID=2954384 RepID=A0A935W3F2_9PROT|nr:putative DNA-binding domain-containing protein [Candidatus Accumulibacter affinis]